MIMHGYLAAQQKNLAQAGERFGAAEFCELQRLTLAMLVGYEPS